ncbi:hypothetical protein EDD22DRAFT_912306 [Suillus occidentalis]|nr:hypothetical protein EDD22DRAFT_912306 [Suillus occidentalis]
MTTKREGLTNPRINCRCWCVEMARQDDHGDERRLYTLPARSSISRISNGDTREMGSLDAEALGLVLPNSVRAVFTRCTFCLQFVLIQESEVRLVMNNLIASVGLGRKYWWVFSNSCMMLDHQLTTMYIRPSAAAFVILFNFAAVNAGIVPAARAVDGLEQRSEFVVSLVSRIQSHQVDLMLQCAQGNYAEPATYAESVTRVSRVLFLSLR